MYVVILAGGSGTRFWPLSRTRMPKQLISVFGGKSMLQRTVERVLPLKPERILVVTNVLQADESRRQLLEYQHGAGIDIIEEPVGRNTAPAIGLAAAIIAAHDPDAVMLTLPADHYITDEKGFHDSVGMGMEAAAGGSLVTMGVVPTRPETGYGYIEADKEIPGAAGSFPVRRFVEKPDLERAAQFLASGSFYWNSGMFVWRVDAILDGIAAFMPELTAGLARLVFNGGIWALEALRPAIEDIYRDLKGESIDYGVMEKAGNVVVIPVSFGWSDVGSWSAIPEVMGSDGNGNLAISAAGEIVMDCEGCFVFGNGKAIALVGVSDLIVVESDDALLVCNRDRAQDVKKVVAELEKRGLGRYL